MITLLLQQVLNRTSVSSVNDTTQKHDLTIIKETCISSVMIINDTFAILDLNIVPSFYKKLLKFDITR